VRILAGRLQAVVQDLFAVGHFAVYGSLQIDARVLPIGWDRQTLICSAAHGLTWATSHVKSRPTIWAPLSEWVRQGGPTYF
jgi:hypothetical protein